MREVNVTSRIIRRTGLPKSDRPLVHISWTNIQWSFWMPWALGQYNLYNEKRLVCGHSIQLDALHSKHYRLSLAEIRLGCCRVVQRGDGGHTSPLQVSRLNDPISGAH